MLISFAHTQRGPQNPKFYLCPLLVGLPPSTVHLRLPLNFHLWSKEKKKGKWLCLVTWYNLGISVYESRRRRRNREDKVGEAYGSPAQIAYSQLSVLAPV